MTYSDAVYTVTVRVILTEDNTLRAEAHVNDVRVDGVTCAFENVYVFETPDTGDSQHLTAWLCALFVSSIALFTLVVKRKKIRD